MIMKILALCYAFALFVFATAEQQQQPQCNPPCSTGEKCVLQRVQCVRFPCDPVPVCVKDPCNGCKGLCTSEDTCGTPCDVRSFCLPPPPPTGCAAMLCAVGHRCVEGPDGQGRCLPSCALIDCQPGYDCIEGPLGGKCVPVTCKVTGCPKGEKCVSSNISGYRCVSTCAIRHCAETQVCSDTPTGAVCDDAESCDQVTCNPGRRCVGGPFGRVRCVDTCATKRCMPGFKCVESPFGAHCVALTCRDLTCRPYERCVQLSTGAKCVGTCALVRCAPGYKCVESSSGAKCVPLTCRDLTCKPYERCVELSTGAKCVGTCATVRCPNCIETDDGPKCVPLPPTCNTIKCREGETCVSGRTFVCKKPPCIQPFPKCVPICEAPKDPGPCKAAEQMYYYNSKSKQCEQFVYGGCQGNGNRFRTKEECEQTCILTCNDLKCPVGQQCVQEPIYCTHEYMPPCPQPPPKCVPKCKGGKVWNDCGSPCTKTCKDPNPGCIEKCEPKCECPADKPIWHRARCIAASQCPVKEDRPCKRPGGGYDNPLRINGRQLCCGLCMPRDECPTGYYCDIHPTDRYAVCCPNRR
ncbi:keratin-associated protein 10-7 isoform X2 [Lingula anatina]|uniref:Keratin-associated protein 10-7 isoform X2 n=1 Tax=Lingula anatina TaxID=7574 RepID=A0A1S3IVP3_LINAN|nr:keratin-associated protein 10-7 isoform X2 [Lingula anatina]|eukprot:XP_013401614.1 keratin-associated protein 10-7 isoform X2 [Lingula anatina]